MSLIDEGNTIASIIRPTLPEGFMFRRAKKSLQWVAKKDGVEYAKLIRVDDRWTLWPEPGSIDPVANAVQWTIQTKIILGIYEFTRRDVNGNGDDKIASLDQRRSTREQTARLHGTVKGG